MMLRIITILLFASSQVFSQPYGGTPVSRTQRYATEYLKNDGSTNNTPLVASIPNVPMDLYIPHGTYVFSTSTATFPANVHLIFEAGAKIQVSASQTVKFAGKITAPETTIFTGTGKIDFDGNSITEIKTCWFDITTGVVDSTTAVNNLNQLIRLFYSAGEIGPYPIEWFGVIEVNCNQYSSKPLLTTTVLIDNTVSAHDLIVYGHGQDVSKLRFQEFGLTEPSFNFLYMRANTKVVFSDMTIEGAPIGHKYFTFNYSITLGSDTLTATSGATFDTIDYSRRAYLAGGGILGDTAYITIGRYSSTKLKMQSVATKTATGIATYSTSRQAVRFIVHAGDQAFIDTITVNGGSQYVKGDGEFVPGMKNGIVEFNHLGRKYTTRVLKYISADSLLLVSQVPDSVPFNLIDNAAKFYGNSGVEFYNCTITGCWRYIISYNNTGDGASTIVFNNCTVNSQYSVLSDRTSDIYHNLIIVNSRFYGVSMNVYGDGSSYLPNGSGIELGAEQVGQISYTSRSSNIFLYNSIFENVNGFGVSNNGTGNASRVFQGDIQASNCVFKNGSYKQYFVFNSRGNVQIDNCKFDDGIQVSGTDVKVSNCTFTQLYSDDYNNDYLLVLGLVDTVGATGNISSCSFYDRTNARHVALSIPEKNSRVKITDCGFFSQTDTSNILSITSSGEFIQMNAAGGVSFENCTFNAVSSGYLGSYIEVEKAGFTTFDNCNFELAGGNIPVMLFNSASHTDTADVAFFDCRRIYASTLLRKVSAGGTGVIKARIDRESNPPANLITYSVAANAADVAYRLRGTTAQRPGLASTDNGYEYYDEDLDKLIIWNGSAWLDAIGGTP